MGLGYRSVLHESIVEHQNEIDWVEVTTDHFIDAAEAFDKLREIAGLFPVVPHSLELSIGSGGGLDMEYLRQVRKVADAVDAPWASDHLCFTREDGIELGSLTPVQRTRSHARHIARKAQQVQDELGRRFLMENITYYVELPGQLTEAEFITEVMEHCECGILLDLTNALINAHNHGSDPYEFVDGLPLERVEQVHLAGSLPVDNPYDLQIDGHNARLGDDVLELLDHLLERQPVKGILLERDDEFPDDFGEILQDLERARRTAARWSGS